MGSRMSIFHTMGSPAIEDQTRVRDLLVVVDAGATYSPIPKPVADALVMRAVRRAITRPADGRRMVREMGHARLREPPDPDVSHASRARRRFLLGALTLEELGVEVDRFRKRCARERP